jgi:uncharacterized RDD family membrane protein YckC
MKEVSTHPPVERGAGTASAATIYEGLSVELVPAPVLKRYLAFAVDMGIISAILYGGFIVFAVLLGVILGAGVALRPVLRGLRDRFAGLEAAGIIGLLLLLAVIFLALFLIFDGYFIWFEYKKGTTPGKRLFGMRVVSLRGSRLTLGQCMIREAFRLLDCLLVFPGLISVAATQRRQRLGDLVAGAMVIYSLRSEKKEEYLYLAQDRYLALLERFGSPAPDEKACRDFLAFAYGEFVLGRQKQPEETLDQWDQYVRERLPQTEREDRQTRLLFYAELCFQTMNGNPPRRTAGT